MGRKGISDIIAVVLMIAVAISIGVFVTTFATSWVQDQTDKPSMTCALQTNYIVEDAKFNYSGKDGMQLKITNKGDQTIHGFDFVVENVTKIVTFELGDPLILNQVTSGNPLKREESALVTINMTTCTNQTLLYCNTSSIYPPLARSATKITVRNAACDAVSASITSFTLYP